MIDLTPLDVRKKRGDFRRTFRGYDPEEVDTFLELVAERFEELVKENLTLSERTERLQEQVSSQLGRERAVQEALVTAQELRDDIRDQAQREAEEIRHAAEREAELVRKEAEAEGERIVARARRQLEERKDALDELERKRLRFLRSFRGLLQRELDVVEVEEGRPPLEEAALELDLGGGLVGASAVAEEEALSVTPDPIDTEPRKEEDPWGSPPEEPKRETPPPAGAEEPEEPVSGAGAESAPPEEEADPGLLSAEPLPPDDEEADPRRWLSSLVERELNEKSGEDPWS